MATFSSKQNQNVAWKALCGFALGFILLFVSVGFICWNERSAVNYTNYIDWLKQEDGLIEIGENEPDKISFNQKSAYLVSGYLVVTEDVRLSGFEDIITNLLSFVENKVVK